MIGGIAFGVLCGYLVKFVPERNDGFLVPLRVLLLLTGGLVSVLGSEEIGWGGAGQFIKLPIIIVTILPNSSIQYYEIIYLNAL